MSKSFISCFLVSTLVLPALVIPIVADAQARPCAAVSPVAQQRIAALTGVLTSANADYVAYAQAMHITGVAPSDIVAETDPSVCTAVTDAIAAYLRGHAAISNYLVLRAGNSRFIALDPTGSVSFVYSVSASYDDVQVSLK